MLLLSETIARIPPQATIVEVNYSLEDLNYSSEVEQVSAEDYLRLLQTYQSDAGCFLLGLIPEAAIFQYSPF